MKYYLNNNTINKTVTGGYQPSTAWSPSDLGSALALWLDADDADSVTLNGSSVSQWNDKSGNNYNVTQSNASSQPLYASNAVNNLAVINFADIDDYLINTNISVSPPFSLFMVAKLNVDGATLCHYFDGGVDSNERVFFRSDASAGTSTFQFVSRNIDEGDGSGVEGITSTWPVGLNPHILHAYDAGNIVNASSIWANGTQIASGSMGSERLRGITIGQWINYSLTGTGTPYSLRGYVGEILIINATISADQRQKTEGYLAHKWGLTANLPNDHPYKNSAP